MRFTFLGDFKLQEKLFPMKLSLLNPKSKKFKYKQLTSFFRFLNYPPLSSAVMFIRVFTLILNSISLEEGITDQSSKVFSHIASTSRMDNGKVYLPCWKEDRTSKSLSIIIKSTLLEVLMGRKTQRVLSSMTKKKIFGAN